ncbi:uncharacterized protein LY89DRAFT_728953 [Mollisia scopiformis]|uniref:Uncharacterized protein n=1 Tax=Mollisia scopiformis TaxID=149040 RepID=A0A194XSY5_MOLSC|nr:uncharacterized protein LY89DRAFT_728953 [Mollisia scopiformis]KUJ22842.1 hypothetical protein LY89DRAFT_728953 [Mollisia scopiformis]
MFSTTPLSLLVLAISTLTTALPAVTKRDTCTLPTSFTISGFTAFYPAAGNTHNQTTSFEFGDSSTSSELTCTVSGAHGPDDVFSCSDPTVSFSYDGTETSSGSVTIYQMVSGCAGCIDGSVFVSTDCIPAEVPFGLGTNCEMPTVSLTGEFSSS